MNGANKKGFFATGSAHFQREEAIKKSQYSVLGDVFREIFIGPDHAELRDDNAEHYVDDPVKQRRIRAAQKDFSFNNIDDALNTIGRIRNYFLGFNDADDPNLLIVGGVGRFLWRCGRTVHNILRVPVIALGILDRGCQMLAIKLDQASKYLWKMNIPWYLGGYVSEVIPRVGSIVIGALSVVTDVVVNKVTKAAFLGLSAFIDWDNSYKRAEMRDKETETGVFWRAVSVAASVLSWAAASVFTGGVAAIPGAVGAVGAIAIAPTATVSIPSMAIPGVGVVGHIATPATKIVIDTTYGAVLGACPGAAGGIHNVVKNLTESEEKAKPSNTPDVNVNNDRNTVAARINEELDTPTNYHI